MGIEQSQQLRIATDEYLLHILDGLPSEDELAARLTFSAAFKRKMRRLLRKARKMETARQSAVPADSCRSTRRVYSIRKKRLLLVAIILSIFVSVMSIASAREAVFGFFMRIYHTFTEIVFNRDLDLPPETTQPLPADTADYVTMVPALLPEGYKKVDQLEAGDLLQITYFNPNGDELVFERQVSDTLKMIIDTESVQIDEVQICDFKGFFFIKKNFKNLVWLEEPFMITIYGNITKEELINMAESINR